MVGERQVAGPPASGRHKGTIGKLLLISAQSCQRDFGRFENAWGKNAFRSLHSFCRQPCVYRKLKLGRSGGEVRQGWRLI